MTTSGGKLISQMKLVSVLNMSPSGMQLHFYSLTLHELKLISWMCRFLETPAAGRSLNCTGSENLPLFPYDSRIILIKDLSWTTSATAVRSPFFQVFLWYDKADGILPWGSSDSLTFHEHKHDGFKHNRKKNNLSHRTRKSFVDWYIVKSNCGFSE